MSTLVFDGTVNVSSDHLGLPLEDLEEIDPSNLKCDLDTWYQMLSILFMLLIYCEIVVFIIFFCSVVSFMKRFFLIVDEIPFEQQRVLAVSEGGRGHPLFRRTFEEYRHAFDYAHFILSRGRITRASELRYLQNYKTKMRNASARDKIKTVIYRSSAKPAEAKESPILPEKTLVNVAINETCDETLEESLATEESKETKKRSRSLSLNLFKRKKPEKKKKSNRSNSETEAGYQDQPLKDEEIFEKFQDCTICLENFKNGQKVKIMPNCYHLFHESCCIQWLDFKFTCPNCNLAIDLRPRDARLANRFGEEGFLPGEGAHNLNI